MKDQLNEFRLLNDTEIENKKRSKSPIFKIQSELLYSGNKKIKVTKKEINIIPGTEEDL